MCRCSGFSCSQTTRSFLRLMVWAALLLPVLPLPLLLEAAVAGEAISHVGEDSAGAGLEPVWK